MKRVLVLLIFIFELFFTASCKKEDPAQLPIVSTTPATNITVSTATSGGTITDDGGATVTANGVCWSTNANPSVNDSKTVDGGSIGQFVSNISSLTGGTTYHIRAYATNSVGTAYGADMSFATLGQSPVGLTQPATNISATGATLNGTANPNYLSTTVTFEYGTSINYGQTATASQSPITGNSITNVSVALTGLTAGSIYHFRIKTVNSLGTTYGDDMTFTTSGSAPSSVTQAACCLSTTSATLNGVVNANYLTTAVTFEYGTTTAYGNSIAANQSPLTGNTNTNVSSALSGLEPETAYHFRVRAENSLGTTYGSDMTFSTTPIPSTKSGLYTIRTGTDDLYFIDINTFTFTKIADIGLTIESMFMGMQYKDHKLYISYAAKLYTYDMLSNILTLVINNTNLAWQFSINSMGELYSVTEITGTTPGSLYKINISNNTSVRIGGTSAASIWGLGFDASDQLWSVEEFIQRYGTINTSTGTFTATSAMIPFTDTYYATPDNNGNLYSFNVGNPATGIVKYNLSSNSASMLIPLAVTWSGLAFGLF